MKKTVSFVLVIILVFSMSVHIRASENVHITASTMFSFYNNGGELVTVVISRTDTTVSCKVYVEGTLTQRSTASSITQTIDTVVYDLSQPLPNFIHETTGTMNGFETSIVHAKVSDERIDTTMIDILPSRSLYAEPVDNTGLSSSGYGDGYYFLGTYGGFYYAPNIYGYLYRAYSRTYDGQTHYWSWGPTDTLSAISAYISLFGGPVSAIIGILVFAANEVLAYYQAVNLATYTYDYDYKVRVYEVTRFTTERNITYWRIDNITTGNTRWVQKSFNYGFSMANTEMVKAGIDNYLNGSY